MFTYIGYKMAKAKNKAAAKTAAPAAPAAPAAGTIQLVAGATPNFRANSARANWYALIVAQVGSTPAQFAAAAQLAPPSLQPKGKYGLANKCEPPQGWLSWFARNGYCTLA